MSHRTERWLFCLGLLVMAMLLVGGSAAATDPTQPRDLAWPTQTGRVSAPAAPASVGMSDLMSQTFEFSGGFPPGWRVYDAISQSTGLDYYWGSTVYTRAEGAHSASAVRGGLDGASSRNLQFHCLRFSSVKPRKAT